MNRERLFETDYNFAYKATKYLKFDASKIHEHALNLMSENNQVEHLEITGELSYLVMAVLVATLAQGKGRKVTKLDFSDCNMADEESIVMAVAVKHPKINITHVAMPKTSTDQVQEIWAKILPESQVTHFAMRGISNNGMKFFANNIKDSKITHLDLSEGEFRDSGLVPAIKVANNLRYLNIAKNASVGISSITELVNFISSANSNLDFLGARELAILGPNTITPLENACIGKVELDIEDAKRLYSKNFKHIYDKIIKRQKNWDLSKLTFAELEQLCAMPVELFENINVDGNKLYAAIKKHRDQEYRKLTGYGAKKTKKKGC